jgi:REP element-mobilizing transposase RayT
MSTYTQITYQVIFSAKYREPVFQDKEDRLRLYAYMATVIRNKRCHVYAVNGVEDHLHLLFSLHQSVALGNLIKDVKLAASAWIKTNSLFPGFTNWQRGYSAITYNVEAIPGLIIYVENQEEHHKKESSLEESKRLLREQGIDFDERFLE